MCLYLFFILFLIASEGDGEKKMRTNFLLKGPIPATNPRLNGNRNHLFPIEPKNCERLSRTYRSPYIVFVLYETSGRFLGMGGIIDRKTVITAKRAVYLSSHDPEKLLLLAGSLSPWWSRHSQVRRASRVTLNDFELALVGVNTEWDLNRSVAPVRLMRSLDNTLENVYGKDLGTFGITKDAYHSPGEKVPKTMQYYFSTQTCTKENDCGKDYEDIEPAFNDSIHGCLHENGSYCSGCIGSPVVGVRAPFTEIAGVVVRSSCLLHPRQVLFVKLPAFDFWIRGNSLLGFHLNTKKPL